MDVVGSGLRGSCGGLQVAGGHLVVGVGEWSWDAEFGDIEGKDLETGEKFGDL